MARASRSRPRREPPSVAILDVAFHRASLATPHGQSKAERDRRRARLKVVRSAATVIRHLRLETSHLVRPPLTDFQRALVAGAFGDGTLDRSLTRLRRAEERIRGLARSAEQEVDRSSGSEAWGTLVRAFYGRLSSFVREVDPDLERLRSIAGFLAERPRLDPGSPTLVIAGFPNVGKSSLVARLSSAHPKVAPYPFTTLSVAVGHADLGFDRLQVLDTPGVLGRPTHTNPAEAEAETAVEKAATVVLFVIDPSGTSGYPPEEQEALLRRWTEEYPGLPIVSVETKCDLLRRPNDRLHVSAKTGEGIEAVWAALRPLLRPKGELPPLEESIEEAAPEAEQTLKSETGPRTRRRKGR